VRKTVDALDESLRRFLRTGEVYVAELPGVEVVVDGVDPRALLMLDAIGAAPGDAAPTARVFVYQRNVERVAGTIELVEAEMKSALEREIRLTFLEPEGPNRSEALN
jgi:hypothetical protein